MLMTDGRKKCFLISGGNAAPPYETLMPSDLFPIKFGEISLLRTGMCTPLIDGLLLLTSFIINCIFYSLFFIINYAFLLPFLFLLTLFS